MEGGCLEAFLAPTGRDEGVAVTPAVVGGGQDVARPALCGAAPAPSEPGLRGPRRQQRAREPCFTRGERMLLPLCTKEKKTNDICGKIPLFLERMVRSRKTSQHVTVGFSI